MLLATIPDDETVRLALSDPPRTASCFAKTNSTDSVYQYIATENHRAIGIRLITYGLTTMIDFDEIGLFDEQLSPAYLLSRYPRLDE